jgi:folate-binding protein YgfZ
MDYQYLLEKGGYLPLVDRTILALRGADRHRFLHNFCTAEIKGLAPGKITEAFVLDGKGKTLWFGLVACLEDRILLSGSGDYGDRLLAHLDRYILRDDVQIEDLSASHCGCFVIGDQAEEKVLRALSQLRERVGSATDGGSESMSGAWPTGLPGGDEVLELGLAGGVFANVELAGRGYWLLVPVGLADSLQDSLAQASLVKMELEYLNRYRIEQGTPWYGCDLDDSNLPQELNRDEKAISFRKGCYLGQETVARIDALGHVNQLLVRLIARGLQAPEVGRELHHEGKSVGRITSVARRETDWICLAMLRRQLALSGTILENGTFEVVL